MCRSQALTAAGDVAWGVQSFRHHFTPSVSRQGGCLGTPCSLLFPLVLCWAELEGTGGRWKLVKGGRGGRGARRVRATAPLGHLACCSSLQLFAGTVICPSPGWCCWTLPVKPAAHSRCVRAARLQLLRKSCLGFSLFGCDSWQECAPRCQLSCRRGTGTFWEHSAELRSWKRSCLLTASWNHINNILLALVIEAKRVCCWIKDTWSGHFIS